MVAGAVAGAVATQAVNTGIQQTRNPESFLNQALKYLAIAVLLLSIIFGVYVVANWGFLTDRVGEIISIGGNIGFTLAEVFLPAGLGGVIGYLNPFRSRS